jgi:putative endonuclease
MNTQKKINIGKEGESLAEKYLISENHLILEKNYRNFLGEIDIISERNDTIFFIEVKNWKGLNPLETFTPKKIKKMRNLAEIFLANHPKYAKDFHVSFCLIQIKNQEIIFYKDLF